MEDLSLLESHMKILAEIHKSLEPCQEELLKSKKARDLLTSKEKYAFDVEGLICRINDLSDDLNKIIIYIRRYPLRKFYEENKLDELDYIKYHFEVFVHKIHTILEVMKLLVNELFSLKINEKDCHWSAIKKRQEFDNPQIKQVINNYYHSFKNIINFRNLNTHRGLFQDDEIKSIKSRKFLKSSFKEFNIDIGKDHNYFFSELLINYEIKEYKKKRLKILQSGIKASNYYTAEFINEVRREFIKRFNEL